MTATARTIFDQFGGCRALYMIGGQLAYTDNSITIRFNGCRKSQVVRIRYNKGADLYDVEFFKADGCMTEKAFGVYADDLRRTFENETGLYLSLTA